MILQPPLIKSVPLEATLVFLAGPIQGSPPWQEVATTYLRPDDKLWVANPRRPEFQELDEKRYIEQVEWEHRYLRQADVILFWLAKEEMHDCSRAYAQTTRFELGEALARLYCTGKPELVVGIEEGFSGARYIRKTLRDKVAKVPIVDSLEEACAAAMRLAGR